MYFAEKKILTTLPKMEKAAQAPELKRAFAKHKTETDGHVARLEKVFAAIEKKPQGDAIVGITDEGAEIIKEYKGSPALTPAFSPRRRQSSTMKSLATAHSKPGPMSLASPVVLNCSHRPALKRAVLSLVQTVSGTQKAPARCVADRVAHSALPIAAGQA
jgi:uncharacterized protein DUF892